MKMLPLGFIPFFQLNCSARMCLFSSGCSEREREKMASDEREEKRMVRDGERSRIVCQKQLWGERDVSLFEVSACYYQY